MRRTIRTAKNIIREFGTVVFLDPFLAFMGYALFLIAMVLFAIYKHRFTDADRLFMEQILEGNGITKETVQMTKDPEGCMHFFPLSRRVLSLYWRFINQFLGTDY